MDTYFSMKVFCQVVQSGSFTKAAEVLDISIPMASKHVAHLEKTIQAQLLYRNNRQLKLTEHGQAYYRECALALDILQQAANAAGAGSAVHPSGVLRVTAPVWFACNTFADLVAAYHRQYPDVELVLTLTNKHVDLNGDGEDLALRLSNRLPDNLIARKLTELKFMLVASEDYVAQHGLPRTPEELATHRSILPSYTDMSQQEMWLGDQKIRLQINHPVIRSNNTRMIAALISAGAGIGYMPEWLANEGLAEQKLVRVMPDYDFPTMPLYAVYANRHFMNPRIRSFIDFLAEYWRDCDVQAA